jgi:hypothetical protein
MQKKRHTNDVHSCVAVTNFQVSGQSALFDSFLRFNICLKLATSASRYSQLLIATTIHIQIQ